MKSIRGELLLFVIIEMAEGKKGRVKKSVIGVESVVKSENYDTKQLSDSWLS